MLFPEFKSLGSEEWFAILAASCFVLLIINYCINLLPVSLFSGHSQEGTNVSVPASVIICAKNEEEHLAEFLPKVLEQDYPNFEVIVVNDCSWDHTENVIDEFAKIFPNLKKVSIKEDDHYKHGKKFAVLVGIKAAKNDCLVFTDADCYPASNQWLRGIVAAFGTGKEIVLGYGAYEKSKGLLNKLIRFDTFVIAVQFLSAAIKNKAYMGVGRNLAYSRNLFFKQKGFATHYHIDSGDDDLFVNQAADEKNTGVIISPATLTYSKPEENFKSWTLQKARHLTTAPYYNLKTKMRLGLNYASLYVFYISLIPLFMFSKTLLLIIIFLILKSAVQIACLKRASEKMNEKDLLWGVTVYEFCLLWLYPFFQVAKMFYKPNQWNR